MDKKTDWKAIWWTTIIVAITTIVIGGILQLLMKNVIYKSSYDLFQKNVTYSTPNGLIQGFFLSQQADYFPLLFLVVMLFVVFIIVVVYRIVLPSLPENWIFRGLIVGASIFLVGDLPLLMQWGYTTAIPPAVAQGRAVAELVNWLINGCILTYCYYRFSFDYDKGKMEKSTAQTKGPRL
jgi:hypothetical protein